MKCYDFELNISAYIEGELKKDFRNSFNEHRRTCASCQEKLADITQCMKEMPKIKSIVVSDNFIDILNKKIKEINNKGPSFLEKIMHFRPFGLEPIPALGFSFALVMVISASYFFINIDKIPEIDMEKLSIKSPNVTPEPFKPSLVIPPHTGTSIADSDSSVKPNISNRYNNKIKLTGGK